MNSHSILELIAEIEKTVSYMEKLKEDSGEKDTVVQEIKNILPGIKQRNKARSELKTKSRKTFSIFKK